MKRTILVTACVAVWSLHMATCEAQDAPAEAKAPAATTPSQPVAKPATKPAAVVAKPADAMLRAIAAVEAQPKGPTIDDICEVKHYKRGKLYGFGLVLNLKAIAAQKAGADEAEAPKAEDVTKLVELLNLLNFPIGDADSQKAIVEKLQGADQLTVVAVTAEVPPEGLRQGDRVDCEVNGIDGASVDSGYLLATRLATLGPGKEPGAAIAAGPLDSETHRTSGPRTVIGGCLVENDICDEFTQDGKITLVLGEEYAEFSIAQEVVDLINLEVGAADQPVAKALNRFNVEISIPADYEEDPVAFVTQILKLSAPDAIAEESDE